MTFKIKPALLTVFAATLMVVFAWLMAVRTERDMRDNLLLQTEIGARSINIDRVKNLTGTPADLKSTDYLRLKEQFAAIMKVNKKLRFVYLMGCNDKGSLFFYADDRPVGHIEESPAGMIYDDAPEGFYRVMKTGIAVNISIMRTFIKVRNASHDIVFREELGKLEKGSNSLFKVVFERLDQVDDEISQLKRESPALPHKRKKIGFRK